MKSNEIEPSAPDEIEDSTYAAVWHIRPYPEKNGHRYRIEDSNGVTVTSGVANITDARLIAYAPNLLWSFKELLAHADHFLADNWDINFFRCSVAEVADDEEGQWQESHPGAPAFARWILNMEELLERIERQYLTRDNIHD